MGMGAGGGAGGGGVRGKGKGMALSLTLRTTDEKHTKTARLALPRSSLWESFSQADLSHCAYLNKYSLQVLGKKEIVARFNSCFSFSNESHQS